jgi:medium-chain acyl-[acyl-carrier-protein] hydrolase
VRERASDEYEFVSSMVSSSEGELTPWLIRRPSQSARLRLFCFPYAGGSALTFRAWGSGLPPDVEVCAVQLPGHGTRMKEQPFARLGPLVRDAAAALRPHLNEPFAFFGHSMGALVAFEVARLLRKEHRLAPRQLFVSGARAPQLDRTEPTTYDLPDSELLEDLRNLNGTPKEVLEEPELMRMLLPILRADFAVCQTYEYAYDLPLECPVTAFGGTVDTAVSRESLEAWRAQTTSDFSFHLLPGDHFFLNVEQALLLRLLTRELRRLTERNR